MKWYLVLFVYAAPPDAVNWDGPWTADISHAVEGQYDSEADCRNDAVRMIGKLHEGMLAPIRYRCIPMPATLPKGAPR